MLSVQVSKLNFASIENWQVYLIFGLALAVILAFYVLRSIGLFILAKRQGIKHAFLAWIPGVWVYTACKLIGNVKTFGKPFAKLALIFCIVVSVGQVLALVYQILIYFPLVGNFFAGREICYAPYITEEDVSFLANYREYATNSGIYVTDAFVNPYGVGLITVNRILSIISIISGIFDLATTVILILIYINLFRKFWPQHYVLASILSVFGLFAPFAFVIRKKSPVNYMDYIRSRYNYNPYGNPYGNPNGGYGRQSGPYNNPYGAPPKPEHPFEEFADKGEVDPGDPFSEFSSKKKPEDPFSEFDKK